MLENTFLILTIQFNTKKMKNNITNLFIFDNDVLSSTILKYHLKEKFGENIVSSAFSSGKSALEKIDKNTNLVILDYFLEGEDAIDIVLAIKKINPKIKLLMLSCDEDVTLAIESFRKGEKASKKTKKIIYDLIA